jgi:hypothetical protein
MPYFPFDTGWMKFIYGFFFATWFIMSRGLCTRKYMFTLFYNIIYGPLMSVLFKSIGLMMSTIGTSIVCGESIIFNKFDYIAPIYSIIKQIESILPSIRSCPRPMYSTSPKGSSPSNTKSSSGRHLCTYFARKRMRSKSTIIYPNESYYTSSHASTKKKPLPSSPDIATGSTPPSCATNTTTSTITSPIRSIFHALSKATTYVLANKVMSPDSTVSVSSVPPHAEPNALHKHMKVRSGGDNIGPRIGGGASIALDSASSIHLFKDKALLDNIRIDNKKKMKVQTTDSTFHVKNVGDLSDSLKSLPLPSEGYYYYPKGVANILSLALLAKTKRVTMDTAIENAFCVYNEDGSFVKFVPSNNGMYCLEVGPDASPHIMAIQTVSDEQSKFSNIDCTRAEAVRKLQEVMACPSDYDLSNAVEHNVIGNTPFTRRDVRIAKQIYGPDVAALKGKTVKQQSKMPREDESIDVLSILPKNTVMSTCQSMSCM